MQTFQRACLASTGSEYNSVFGPGGILERARQHFLSTRFSPRKPLLYGEKLPQTAPSPLAEPQQTTITFRRPGTPLRLAA